MNKRLNDAVTLLKELPDAQQEAAAAMLWKFLDAGDEEANLTPEQIAEVELSLKENDYATDEEVEAFFAQLKK
ncbi:MAG TPA: hypothetical protein VFX37_02410 [Pseudolabrys sp.]|nr:hypothetical protein [Pseudolabrys sp.]